MKRPGVRATLAAAMLTAAVAGCGQEAVGRLAAQPGTSPQAVSPPAPPASGAAPSPAAPRLTLDDARKAAESWLADHNRTVKDRHWWDDDATRDRLFAFGTRHEIVLERGSFEDGRGKPRKPITLTGERTYYVPRDQPPDGEWFILRATYKGQDRAHVLAFWREPGRPFKLAAKTPLHYGQKVPEPVRDAEGYVTAAPPLDGLQIARAYMNFWEYPSREGGAGGYRLAKDNYSRRSYPAVTKGLYAAYRSHSPPHGFRTADGGSFYLFSLLNKPEGIVNVLTVGVATRKGGKAVHEIAGDWFA
ncbi:hypothetical protein D5H75_13470 [Bailinhaonella thermotolerans]|uniref:DUF8094 domain-containing protein n=1 Tax=Bailinhaonella thermotolerans TaxID=1070861 RepID=A0A3A4B3B3_9ACTN|nr:hypothetical protein D5H75_13470 [Bailinhaonella thermotolerans]